MPKSIVILLNIIFLFNISFADDLDMPTLNGIPSRLIRLHNDNLVTVRGQIDGNTASNFINDIQKLEEENIFIYLLTPGGSVVDGFQMIQIIDTLSLTGKNISCIAQFAHSMGFALLQSCPNRFVQQGTIVMQHQISLSLEGQYHNIKNRMRLVNKIYDQLIERQRTRIGLSPEEFQNRILSDWWLLGNEIVDENVADAMVNVLCDSNLLQETYVKEFELLFFGKIRLTFSKCPLVFNPLKVEMGNNNSSAEMEFKEVKDQESLNKIINTYYGISKNID